MLEKIQRKRTKKFKLIFFSSKTDPPGNVIYFTSVVVTQGAHIGENELKKNQPASSFVTFRNTCLIYN